VTLSRFNQHSSASIIDGVKPHALAAEAELLLSCFLYLKTDGCCARWRAQEQFTANQGPPVQPPAINSAAAW
jgi:hypothetical protein